MQIKKDASVAVVVRRAWANLHGVRIFLRRKDQAQTDIRGVDDSHIIFAMVLDSEDTRGIWIQLQTDKDSGASVGDRFILLIPWTQVLTIVLAEQFSPAIRQEARKIGFTGETEQE